MYVSGNGATFAPGRLTPIFGRVKGETELRLAEMRKANPAFHASSIRPAFIDSAAHDAIKPYLPSTGVLATVFGPGLRAFAKSRWSPTEPLGKFMTEMAMGRWDASLEGLGIEKVGDFPVVENVGFRRLAKQDV